MIRSSLNYNYTFNSRIDNIIDTNGDDLCIVYKYNENNSNENNSNIHGYRYVYNKPICTIYLELLSKCNYLEFCPSFNNPIDNLPDNIEFIIFPINSDFNQPINNLPSKLKHLELYDNFNQPLDNLPHGVKTLIINSYYNHPLDNLPESLENLEIRGEFNYSLNNLPRGLKTLIIKDVYDYNDYHLKSSILRNYDKTISKFNQPIDISVLPSELEYIEIINQIYLQKN